MERKQYIKPITKVFNINLQKVIATSIETYPIEFEIEAEEQTIDWGSKDYSIWKT